MRLKILNENDPSHEFLPKTRQKIKLRNASNNKMSTDIKLSKAQISKLIQSGGFLRSLLSKLTVPLVKVAELLAKNILTPLGKTANASELDTWTQKKCMVLGQLL